MQGAVPDARVAPLLSEHFIAVAADADDPEPEVMALAGELEDAMMLPFVLFADAEGQFLRGYAGTASPPYLVRMLEQLTSAD